MECHACGLKGHKIKECQTKQYIYIVNLKKTVKSKLEIREEMQQHGNIKSVKVRRDRHGYEMNEAVICSPTQKEAEKAITQINNGTEWHAEIYQNRYTEINEGRKKKANENHSNEESERNKTNSERQNQKSRKGIDKWQEEMDILKSDVSQIKEYIKTIMDNKE